MDFSIALCVLMLACTGMSAHEPAASSDRSITVKICGEVSNPARYVLPRGATALEALVLAGRMTEDGDPARIRLVHVARPGKSKPEVINVRKIGTGEAVPPILQDGDTLLVPRLPICRWTF